MEAYELEEPYPQFDDEFIDDADLVDYGDETVDQGDNIVDQGDNIVDYLIYDDGYIEQVPRWTRQRVIWFLIATVIILAMIGIVMMPFLQTIITAPPTYMPPPVTPPSQL